MNKKLLQLLNNREQNYPNSLAEQYPRILAKILELWDSPDVDAYFTELLVTKRSDRQGFPAEVASDIMYLSMVHGRQQNHPKNAEDIWEMVPEGVKQEIEHQGFDFSREGFIKAAESGQRDAVGLFLSAGVEVDTCDERLWTPLMISAFNGNEEIAELLIRSGANVNHADTAGYTPLHWASFNGFSRVVRLLLNKEIDVDARSTHGWTALLQAATRGHLTVSAILIDHGASVNAASNDGWAPLHKAAANGHFAEVMLLLSRGVDVHAKYKDGTTALDIAIKNKHDKIIAALSAKG